MKKQVKWIIAIVLIAAVGYFGYGWYARRAARKAAALDAGSIATAKVERRDLEVDVTGTGTVQSNLKKNIQPGVAGTVSQVLAKEGDLVKAGDPVLILTNDTVRYQADQANLDLALAQQTLSTLTGPAGSKAKAELAVDQAQLNLDSAQDKVDALGVKSPLDGEVFDVAVKVGDAVKLGQTVATVADTSGFTVDFPISQANLHKYTVGDSVSIGSIQPDDYAWKPGVLTSISKEGVTGANGVAFTATATVNDPDPAIRAGMSVMTHYRTDEGTIISTRGTVNAQDKRDVKAEADGTVTALLASEGSSVSKDQAVVQLENDSAVFALQQAKNALVEANQSLATYQDSITSQELKVEQARVAADDKATTASKLVVKSPIDGKILSIAPQAGDDVTATQTVVSVAQVSPLTVVIPVDELDVPNVAVGQPAKIEIDALPGETFEGVVDEIAQEGTVQQGITNFSVTIKLDSDKPRLGMSATATIAVAQKSQVLTIPVEAVKWDQGQAYVNQVADGQVAQKRVKIGVQSDLYAEVASGLNEGETVLTGNLPSGGLFNGLRMPGRVQLPGGGQARQQAPTK